MDFLKEKRYNKIALLLFVLIASYIFTDSPFILSIYTSIFLRYLLFLIIIIFSFLMIFKKKKNIVFLLFLGFFVFQFLYYITSGANFWEAYNNLMCFSLAIVLMLFVKRSYSLKVLLIDFYFSIVLLFSILSIISFITFNLELAPFELKAVGEGLDVYMSYHNYLLGYVSMRDYEMGEIGRVCGFMFEPSYQAWFLSTNLFLVSKYLENKRYLRVVQSIIFLGALSTFSTMVWAVLTIVFFSIAIFKFFSMVGLDKKTANILYSLTIVFCILTVFTVVTTDKIIEKLGTSSADDRTDRIDTSFLYLTSASAKEYLLGRGPGFIGEHNDRGESNPIIKSLVENGVVATIFVFIFVVYCTYRSKYYMIAIFLWLNSVVILFTPLFVINLLVCRWMDEQEPEPEDI